MQTKLPKVSKNYLAGLRKYLQDHSSVNLQDARRLGIQAVKTGLETLELAKIHENALITLLPLGQAPRAREAMIRHASAFFAEAITPIEETHPGAEQAQLRLKVVIQSLSRRSVELATLNKKLEEEIIQRKAVEASLLTSEQTTSQLLEKSRAMQEELRHLSRRLISVQEEERKRISRELHDVIAQTLTSINLQLAALKTLSADNFADLRKRIAAAQKLVEKSVDIVHDFARDLRPTVLDDLGLIPALHAYLKRFMEQRGIRVAFTAYAGVEKLDNAVRTVLYRVTQEALTNVARHAGASRAKVIICKENGTVRMEICDNGRGFDVEKVARAKSEKRLGLLGMRERVEMVGGAFRLDSTPGGETKLEVEIPLNQAPARTKKKRRVSLKHR